MRLEDLLIITNNPLVKNINDIQLYMIEGDCKDVVAKVLSMVSEGHQLISHPLAGSVKPNQNPYKSILISQEKGQLDYQSVKILNSSLLKIEQILEEKILPDLASLYSDDLQLTDYDLLLSALQSI